MCIFSQKRKFYFAKILIYKRIIFKKKEILQSLTQRVLNSIFLEYFNGCFLF